MRRESRARSRCGLWRGEWGADGFLPSQKHPNGNLGESIHNTTLLTRCLAITRLHPRNGGMRMKLPHHTFLAITAASLLMKQNLPSCDSSENCSKKTSAMLLCLEAPAKHGSLVSKTFPSPVLQSQDANNKLAGWGFGGFCTYLREQRCYRSIAEKNSIDHLVVWKMCIISKGTEQGQVCGSPGEAGWDSIQTLLVLLWQVWGRGVPGLCPAWPVQLKAWELWK